MYITMKKTEKIIQTCFSIDLDTHENFMVLVFTKDNQVISHQTIKFPDWFKFYNSEFPYYSPCLN